MMDIDTFRRKIKDAGSVPDYFFNNEISKSKRDRIGARNYFEKRLDELNNVENEYWEVWPPDDCNDAIFDIDNDAHLAWLLRLFQLRFDETIKGIKELNADGRFGDTRETDEEIGKRVFKSVEKSVVAFIQWMTKFRFYRSMLRGSSNKMTVPPESSFEGLFLPPYQNHVYDFIQILRDVIPPLLDPERNRRLGGTRNGAFKIFFTKLHENGVIDAKRSKKNAEIIGGFIQGLGKHWYDAGGHDKEASELYGQEFDDRIGAVITSIKVNE